MIRFIFAIFLILTITFPALIQDLTPDDYKNLTKQKTIENILFERYLNSDKGPVSVMGYHYDSYINENIFTTLAIFGAIGGERGGYGIAAIGIGYAYPISSNLEGKAKLLIGSGGGGGVPAGGGIAIEPQIGLAISLWNNLALQAMVGQLSFPSGSFSSPIYNFGLNYRFYQVRLR